MGAQGHDPADILKFWFGELDSDGAADDEHRGRWFRKSDDFDRAIIERYGPDYEAQCAGEHESWLDDARTCLAYILVYDQFARNMFRDDGKTHARDDDALRACRHAIKSGYLDQLVTSEQVFVLMPLMHAETLQAQDESVREFAALVERCPEAMKGGAQGNHKYAIEHRDIVARFGRFPHRNTLLGRETTVEEEAFLKTPGSSF